MNLPNTGGVTYKVGIVKESKVGFAKVIFDDIDSLITQWLPCIYQKTQNDKAFWTLDIGEQVACLMDATMEDGCILGAIYSDVDTAPVSSKDKFGIKFKDGGVFEYDRSNGNMVVICKGKIDVTASGDVTVNAPKVTINSQQTTCTGRLTVQGLLTYQAGLTGSGGSGGASATIAGNVKINGGDVDADGYKLKDHKHTGVDTGGGTSGPATP